MLEKCRPEVREALDNVLSTFGGEDGGIKFYRFYQLVEDLDVQGQEGNEAADELMNVVLRFSRFINVANKAPSSSG